MTQPAAPHPLLRLLPRHDQRVKAGHPWAFSNEIVMTPAARALPPGGPVRLEGDDGWNHGTWSFNPHSLIAARRLDRDPGAVLDLDWAKRRLGIALALREKLYDTPYLPPGPCRGRRPARPGHRPLRRRAGAAGQYRRAWRR